jgi:hypothetical protein
MNLYEFPLADIREYGDKIHIPLGNPPLALCGVPSGLHQWRPVRLWAIRECVCSGCFTRYNEWLFVRGGTLRTSNAFTPGGLKVLAISLEWTREGLLSAFPAMNQREQSLVIGAIQNRLWELLRSCWAQNPIWLDTTSGQFVSDAFFAHKVVPPMDYSRLIALALESVKRSL